MLDEISKRTTKIWSDDFTEIIILKIKKQGAIYICAQLIWDLHLRLGLS